MTPLRNRVGRSFGCALSAVALLAPGLLVAQEEPPPVFDERVDVRVINVEVVVTDRRGDRVIGLSRDDFVLRVDGREVAIEYFSETVDEARAAPSPAASSGPEGAPVRRPVAAAAPAAARTNLLIFVDDVFAFHTRKKIVMRNLRKQVAELRPEDQVAVVSWNGRRLRVRTAWTSSTGEILRALEEAAKYPSRGIYFHFRPVAELAELMTAAASALRLAGHPEGRKALMLLAGRWPAAPLADDPFLLAATAPDAAAGTGFEDRFLDFRLLWLSRRASIFRPLIDTANALGYTVYPVATEGLPPAGPGVEASSVGEGNGPPAQLFDGALPLLARETGGRVMWAGHRLRALERTLADGRSSYLLGFTSHADEATRHRIEVELTAPGLRARSRTSFIDFDSRMAATSLVEAGLLLEGAASEAAGDLSADLGLRLLDVAVERRRATVELAVDVPTARLTFLLDPAGVERAVVELSIAVADDRGGLSDVTVVPLALERPAARAETRGEEVVTYRQEMMIRAKPHDLMVVLRDVASEEILQGRLRVDPCAVVRGRSASTAAGARPSSRCCRRPR